MEGGEGVEGGKGDRFNPRNILESLHRKCAEAGDLRILLLLVIYCGNHSSSKAMSHSPDASVFSFQKPFTNFPNHVAKLVTLSPKLIA